jgi:hypothetical protein
MFAAPTRAPRTPGATAKLRHAASSVAPVAYGYERSLRPCLACFSRPVSTRVTGGDR